MLNFPDLPHFLKLRQSLWEWPKSRAALMIGAGMSRNAEPLPGASKVFPTWRDLVRTMFDELYPEERGQTGEQERERNLQFAKESDLRLASKYEANFGRVKLDELIRAQNPDSDYEPGELHKLLLELPWADVFTTNYDTLLERTEVLGRAYTPVSHAAQLVSAVSPRILKLHGCFSAKTELIVTEENFRRYPIDYAPFLNTVRQALLENVFVLIGFSGEDPNFLSWSGWIRDELGDQHSRIYLVGPLDLKPAERSLIERRGVTPIDLSPIFSPFPVVNKHSESLKWFLKSLWAARPARNDQWPCYEKENSEPETSGPPLVTSGQRRLQKLNSFNSSPKPITDSLAYEVINCWKHERTTYPGWIVAPRDLRQSLWHKTEEWAAGLIEHSQKWSLLERIRLYREINWRFETAMAPLFQEQVDSFKKAVLEMHVFLTVEEGTELELANAFLYRTDELIEAWLEIACGLLRESRETYQAINWQELSQKIHGVVSRYQKFKDRYEYEKTLWCMWNVERLEAKEILSRWQPSPRNLEAALWKAGLLAEVSELSAAEALLRKSLLEIRQAQLRQGQNLQLLSLEGWCTYLLYFVEWSADIRRIPETRNKFQERWQDLRAWDCNPWITTESFNDALCRPMPSPSIQNLVVYGFDPGHTQRRIRINNGGIIEYLPAFSYIRLHEQVGLPMYLPMVNLSSSLAAACTWIASGIPFWSPALLIRAGKFDEIIKSDILSRVQVSNMDSALARSLHGWCLKILLRDLKSSDGLAVMSSHEVAFLAGLMDVISRLSFKLESSTLDDVFEKVLEFSQEVSNSGRSQLTSACSDWLTRLYEAAEDDTLVDWLSRLLTSPVPYRRKTPERDTTPDPIYLFPSERVSSYVKRANILASIDLREVVDDLIKRANCYTIEERQPVISRLLTVYWCDLMTNSQSREFGALIWSSLNEDGLPNITGLKFSAFVRLPSPEHVDVSALSKKKVLSLDALVGCSISSNESGGFTSIVGGELVSTFIDMAAAISRSVNSSNVELGSGVQWTKQEVETLYSRVMKWWQFLKKFLNSRTSQNFDSVDKGRVGRRLAAFISRILLPNMSFESKTEWESFSDWLIDLRNHSIYVTEALPCLLESRPAEFVSIANLIIKDLSTSDEDAVTSAVAAVRSWAHLSKLGRVKEPHYDMLLTMIKRVIFRQKEGITSVLKYLTFIIAEFPGLLTLTQSSLLSDSLVQWKQALAIESNIIPTSALEEKEFPVNARPRLIEQLGFLAGTLKTWYSYRYPYEQIPDAIYIWEQYCKESSLPECRRAFRDGELLLDRR